MTELRKKMMYYLEAWELTERLIKSGRLYPQSEMRIEWGSDHYFWQPPINTALRGNWIICWP